MAKTYTRKRIKSLDDLDREEKRLRKKAKRIEEDWAEILDPKQLAISFLTQFLGRKLSKRREPKPAEQSGKKFAYGKFREEPAKILVARVKEKKPFIKKAAKVIGISFATLFILRKVVQMRREHKRRKEAAKMIELVAAQ